MWLVLTLLFEFLFGYYVAGKPRGLLLDAYDTSKGNL